MRRAPITALLLLAFSFAPRTSLAQAPAPSKTIPDDAFGEKLHVPGVPNAGKISDVLFRGAQPHANGFAELKKLGVTTVVDLRGPFMAKLDWERKEVQAQGMRFVSIPVSGWSPPTDPELVQFLSLMRDEPQQKVFVHCHYGDDRTGVFVAAYRVTHDHWSSDQAIKEMYYFGFHGFWHPSMESFLRDLLSHMRKEPTFKPFVTDTAVASSP